ncbi:DUF7024 domain-containing protein [Thiomonas sp.]
MPPRKILIAAFFATVIIGGLCISYLATFAVVRADSDSSHSAMLWYGTQIYGLDFIKNWIFTPDNWLLTLVPIDSLLFSIFGPHPYIVLFRGWLFFPLSTALCGLLALQLDTKWSPLIIPSVLLYSGSYGISSGFLTYTVSHNSSMFFGLLMFVGSVAYIKSANKAWLPLIFVLSAACCISDPWFLAAFTLPGEISSFILLLLTIRERRNRHLLYLFAALTASIVVAKTMAFGLLNFIPTFPFSFGSRELVNRNAEYFIKDLGGILNIIPFNSQNFFLTSLASIFMAGLLIAASSYLFSLTRNKENRIPRTFSFIFTALSVAGISFAFIFSNIQQAGYSARFIINILFFDIAFTIILTELAWSKIGVAYKILVVGCGIIFISAGLISNFKFIIRPHIKTQDKGAQDIIKYLKAHNLNYGYGPYWYGNGPYWGIGSNAVTWLSDNKIIIRPVMFNPTSGFMIIGNRPETDKLWYRPHDLPQKQHDYFVFVTNDGDNCANVDICINGLIHQYGQPKNILHHGSAYIMVWPHQLLWAPVDINSRISLNRSYGWSGWSYPESWGTWTDANEATIMLPLSTPPKSNLYFVIDSSAFLAKTHQSQIVYVSANGTPIGELQYTSAKNSGLRRLEIPLKTILKNDQLLSIDLKIKKPMSPASLGISADPRELGIGVRYIELTNSTQ